MQVQSIVEDLPVIKSRVKLVLKKLPSVVEGLKYLKKTDKSEPLSIGAFIERNAAQHPHHPAVLFEDQSYSHKSFNDWVNRYANYLLGQGIKKGDAVAIFMENRPQVLVAVGAAVKLGAIASLINTNQRADALKHSFDLCNPKAYVIGEELFDAFTNAIAI